MRLFLKLFNIVEYCSDGIDKLFGLSACGKILQVPILKSSYLLGFVCVPSVRVTGGKGESV